jgi:hypothetical protein
VNGSRRGWSGIHNPGYRDGHPENAADAVTVLQVGNLQHVNFGLVRVIQVPVFCQGINRVLLNKGSGIVACAGQDLPDDLVQPEVAAFRGAAL